MAGGVRGLNQGEAMRVAILFANPRKKWTAALARMFTGTYAFHCGFYDPTAREFYDISVVPRRVSWDHYRRPWIDAFAFDVDVTREQIEAFMREDARETYSFGDYALFAIRPFFRLFGREAPNSGGVICSELVNNWLWRAGVRTPFDPADSPPSPTDLFLWLSTNGRRIDE